MNRTTITVLALALSACAPVFNGEEHAFSVADRYPITVNEEMATLTVRPSGRNGSLSAYDEAQISNFVSEYKARGHGAMMVATSGTASSRAATEVRNKLAETGLESWQIQDTGFSAAAGDASAPVVLSFKRYTASALECGNWNANLGFTDRNLPWPNFGCATQNNLAAMVLDPHDLVEPRGVDAADPERRAVVLEKYRKGQPTGSQSTSEEDSSVSEAVE